MIELPYGIADFHRIRTRGMVYVDRTTHIRDVEMLGDVLVFLRPRRFGKSLWLQTLANYYDVRRADEFDELFGGLAAGQRPPADRYFILQWNFSKVDAGGGVERISESIREHVSSQAKTFVAQYEDLLPGRVEVEGSPASVLDSILRIVEKTPYKLYLLIDEYDNFINEVMVKDADLYRGLVDSDGPFKQVFKSVKAATEGQGLERVFVTGVSPVDLSDLTSGFNIAWDGSLDPALASLCGFREQEIRGLLAAIAEDRGLPEETVEATLDTIRTWYGGYLFTNCSSAGTDNEGECVYNPTDVLYFLSQFHRSKKAPRKLHDESLRTHSNQLAVLARTSAGSRVIKKLTEGDGTIALPRLEARFSLSDLRSRIGEDDQLVASLLYYMGFLTLTRDVPPRLRIPNLMVRKLLFDHLPDTGRDGRRSPAAAAAGGGGVGPGAGSGRELSRGARPAFRRGDAQPAQLRRRRGGPRTDLW